MFTNEDRHEVAERLRILATHKEVDKEFVEDVLGLYMGGCIDGYDPVSVVHVADLIEPEPERTCELEHAEWDDGQCTWGCKCILCGNKFEHESGTTWNYCPHCGAKVVNND